MWNQAPPPPVAPQQAPMIGPMLRFGNIDINQAVYYASILIVSTVSPAPYVSISYGTVQAPYVLDNFQGWNFYRYDISVPIPQQDSLITYTVNGKGNTFVVPGKQTLVWRWTFWSCNGFTSDVSMKERAEELGGDTPLWNDLLDKHRQLPFHVMVGGGDQLYCDGVYEEVQEIIAWKDKDEKDWKMRYAVSPQLRTQIEWWYFNNYKTNFGSGPFAEAMKIIPFCYILDDHDIFDGWGSYPEWVMKSPMVQNVGAVAFRFYLLFQQHTNPDLAVRHGFFGGMPRSYLTYFGPQQAVLFPDARSERSLNKIMSDETYRQLYDRVRNMSPTVKHLIVVLGVPIVYPRLTLAEKALNKDSVATLMQAFGTGNAVNQFGLPELQDDLNDHWTAEIHELERRLFVENLQSIAKQRRIRVTFIAGDVHCCGAGYFSCKDGMLDPVKDHRYMVQIVSSAIVNKPPPIAVIKMLSKYAKTYQLDPDTDENMFELFPTKVDGQPKDNPKLYNRRNYCAVNPNAQGGLDFTIMVEKKDHRGTIPYKVTAPPLNIQ